MDGQNWSNGGLEARTMTTMKPLRYPIRAVSKLTGISVDTLRAWERRYQVVEPERDDRGRLYSDADVARLKLLREAVERGHAIGRVASLSTEELEALLSRPGPVSDPAFASAAPADLSALQDAVDAFDAAALRRELSRLAAVLPPRALVREVALPFLHLVGEAWHEGKLSVAQEHLVSAELRSLIGALARLQHGGAEGAPRLVFATPEGEPHELGTLIAALVASGAGFGALYLGPGLPASELVAAARRVQPRAVVLGYTGRESAPAAAPVIAALARELPEEVELWIGGAGAAGARAAAPDRIVALEDLDAFEKALSRQRR
jgi:DNA-binding transcriptional MerR regulator/methylmalonyl-CoA mutase cobalamin-binding subunit